MRVESSQDGKTNIVLTKSEWESYGQAMGWNKSTDKQASKPSIKLAEKDGKKYIDMNREGWLSLGKQAQFFTGEETSGEDEYYNDSFEDVNEKEDDYLKELDDVEVEEVDSGDEAFEETVSSVTDILTSSLLGIEDGQVPQQLVPELIMSAIEPMSEYVDIDMLGDSREALAKYLSSPNKSEGEISLKSMIAAALTESGNEV